jgi:hypothetical protein
VNFLKLVNRDEFKEMMDLGFIKLGDYAQTMKHHSKGKRHKKYVREDKYDRYLKYKEKQKKQSE